MTDDIGIYSEISDPYAYTKRNEFTSEAFKLEVSGLPKKFPISDFKRLLRGLRLNAHKIKPGGQQRTIAFVAFKDADSRDKAGAVLNNYSWKKCVLKVKIANPVKDPLVVSHIERKGQVENLTIEERVEKSVIPLSKMPYEDQLRYKEKMCSDVLQRLCQEVSQLRHIQKWVEWQKKKHSGYLCEVCPIVPSPAIDQYRNKNEFTIGINPDTLKKTVGFRITSYKDGFTCVGPVSHLRHIPSCVKAAVCTFERYLEQSQYEPYDPITHQGVWRQLTIRNTLKNDILMIIFIHPQELTEADLHSLKAEIIDHLTSKAETEMNLKSLFFYAFGQRQSGESDDWEHLWGSKSITEVILGNEIQISPKAFFQVNTLACESLYKTIAELSRLSKNDVLLDICCGAGTIGISLAQHCAKVYGIEMNHEAVADAKSNATRNGQKNMHFYEGKAEDCMEAVLATCWNLSTIGILDPPRAGVNSTVINSLRCCDNLKSLVYVSCDANNAMTNLVALCRPRSKRNRGNFFIPIKTVPVDVFPHTEHCEMVFLFEKWDASKWESIMNDTSEEACVSTALEDESAKH